MTGEPHVMIVDDERDSRDMIAHLLGACDAEVISAADAEGAGDVAPRRVGVLVEPGKDGVLGGEGHGAEVGARGPASKDGGPKNPSSTRP